MVALIDEGADPNYIDEVTGLTVLHLAAIYDKRNEDFCRLVAMGANVSIQGKEGHTVAHMAAKGDNLSIFKYLLESCPLIFDRSTRLRKTPYDYAVIQKTGNIVRYLLTSRSGFRESYNRETMDRPLHMAARSGSEEVVSILVFRERRLIYARNWFHQTALHEAAKFRRRSIC